MPRLQRLSWPRLLCLRVLATRFVYGDSLPETPLAPRFLISIPQALEHAFSTLNRVWHSLGLA